MDVICCAMINEKINNMTNKEAAELIKKLVINMVYGRGNGKGVYSACINAALNKAIEALQGKNMFEKARIEEIVNIGYQREPKTWDITVYTGEYSTGVLYKCTSFYLTKYFLVLRTLDSGEQYINLNTIWSFTVNEIKEEAND